LPAKVNLNFGLIISRCFKRYSRVVIRNFIPGGQPKFKGSEPREPIELKDEE